MSSTIYAVIYRTYEDVKDGVGRTSLRLVGSGLLTASLSKQAAIRYAERYLELLQGRVGYCGEPEVAINQLGEIWVNRLRRDAYDSIGSGWVYVTVHHRADPASPLEVLASCADESGAAGIDGP